jgi:hypothetical protein
MHDSYESDRLAEEEMEAEGIDASEDTISAQVKVIYNLKIEQGYTRSESIEYIIENYGVDRPERYLEEE